MVSQRLAGVPMENNGIVAVPGERRRAHDVGVAPGAALASTAPTRRCSASSPSKLRIVCPWVGGGFGPKAAGYVEHLVAAKAALDARPAGEVGRDPLGGHGVARARPRLRDDRQARRRRTTARSSASTPRSSPSAGAYPAIGAILPMLTQMMSVGVYEVPKVRFDAMTVMTNNTTVGAYRGAGRPEATQLIERVLDVAADKIGMDPAEIRRVNFIQPDTFPLTTLTGANYDSGEYEKALDAVLAASGYAELRAEQAARRAARRRQAARHRRCRPTSRSPRRSACTSSSAPSRSTTTARPACSPAPACTARATTPRSRCWPATCSASRWTRSRSSTPTPRPSRAAPARWARARCRPPAARSTWRPTRCSTGPSRSPPTCSRPTADDIVVGDGGLHVAGVPANGVSWAELAAASKDAVEAARRRRAGRPAPRARLRRHRLDVPVRRARRRSSRSTPRPAGSTMLRHVAVDDCGRILNPLLVAGQQHGGIAQGAAQALYEWVAVRRRRQPGHVEPDRLRDPVGGRAAAASRRRTPRPTAPATRSAPRASASRARSARRRRSRTPWSTPSRTSASRTSTCRARPSGCGRRSRKPSRRRSPGGSVLCQSVRQ